jgi:hypothetical protein
MSKFFHQIIILVILLVPQLELLEYYSSETDLRVFLDSVAFLSCVYSIYSLNVPIVVSNFIFYYFLIVTVYNSIHTTIW